MRSSLRLAATCLYLGVIVMVPANAGAQPSDAPEPTAVAADRTVGVFYFAGWSQPDRWHCMLANPDVQHPLLGYYREGDPTVADWHIKWAVEHGVAFFAFDYYSFGGSQMLEAAVDALTRSRFIDRFRFCLNWCNHAAPETQTLAELEAFEELAISRYLGHPSYFRLNGKPLVIILSGYSFVKTLGVEAAREAFRRFDERCREAGLPGVTLVFCEGEIRSAEATHESLDAGIHGFCLYNYPYAGVAGAGPGVHGEAPYADLEAQGVGLWKHWTNLTEGRFWPTVMAGWDRRPWTKDNDLVRTGTTPALFASALRRARESTNADGVVMVEAWNEWGEGSILEPSVEQRFAWLDAVRDVFCPGAAPHTDVDPVALGLAKPTPDLILPSTDRWAFDFGTEGWTAERCTPLSASWGALTTTSLDGDPALYAPPSYLAADRYGAVTVRMRLTGPEGCPSTSTGELFWSTVQRATCEELSRSVPVQLDGKWHDYRLDVAAHPEWRGTIDRLRWDPVALGDVRIEVDELRVVPR